MRITSKNIFYNYQFEKLNRFNSYLRLLTKMIQIALFLFLGQKTTTTTTTKLTMIYLINLKNQKTIRTNRS